MKTIVILPLVLLCACATDSRTLPAVGVVPETILPAEGIESVRYSENVKAYNVGRYVDPTNGRVMHDAHLIYRVETTAKWNLHSTPEVRAERGPIAQSVDRARKDPPLNEEIVAEVNRQKAATQALLNQSERLNQSLQQLSNTGEITKRISEQSARLQQELDATKRRLEAIETDARRTPNRSGPMKPANDDW